MFKINNQEKLFNLIIELIIENTETKDLDDIKKQLEPYDIDSDAFVKQYVKFKKTKKSELCDCDMHQLARIRQSGVIKLSTHIIHFLKTEASIRNCTHDNYAKAQLEY